MYLSSVTLTCLLLLPNTAIAVGNENGNNGNGLRGNNGNGLGAKNKSQGKPCTLLLKIKQFSDLSEEHEVECLTDIEDGGKYVKINGPPNTQETLKQGFENGVLKSGRSTLFDKNGMFNDNGDELEIDDLDAIEIGENDERRRLATVTGTKEMLALRVVAADTSTSSSAATISDRWFGTSGDLVNLKSQMSACSFGQLTCNAANKVTSGGPSITNGVYTVTISNNVNGEADSVIREAIISQATADLGNLELQFDHIMICVPPGTAGSWIAYAYVDWYLSVYNNDWCNYVSAQMHEIGHNLNLGHSGEGTQEYGDQSGMMGYSYSASDLPVMCFNSAKNWQLGWYSDKHITVSEFWSGKIYGISDYDNDSTSVVLIKIPANVNGGSDDYYVSFNAASGINSGTLEGPNQVLIHYRSSLTSYAQSWLAEKLSIGSSSTTAPLPLIVNEINTSTVPWYADITIGVTDSFSPSLIPSILPSLNRSNAPTLAESQLPTTAKTGSPSEPPTFQSSMSPTNVRSIEPTPSISTAPSELKSSKPSVAPTSVVVTGNPSTNPSDSPSLALSSSPSRQRTQEPTIQQSPSPSITASVSPSIDMTYQPTSNSSFNPSHYPTNSMDETSLPSISPTSPHVDCGIITKKNMCNRAKAAFGCEWIGQPSNGYCTNKWSDRPGCPSLGYGQCRYFPFCDWEGNPGESGSCITVDHP